VKGSRRFNRSTADQIRVLLSRVRNADRNQQKALRQQVRDLGFYISDFGRPVTGFRTEDFDELVRTGLIEIL
jgi:hypothetical protein